MANAARFLTALPVYNEASHVTKVLDEVSRHADDVLVVDDGSTDGTSELLTARRGIAVVQHETNQGYGAALKTAFDYGILRCYDAIVTIDCDGQHEPQRIRQMAAMCEEADIVSGSRYLQTESGEGTAPIERARINRDITAQLNRELGLSLTDAFCGFKAYRTCALAGLQLSEPGYGMPLELWVKAVAAGLKIIEVPVPLIYLEEKRSFGGQLDDGDTRREYYQSVLRRAARQVAAQTPKKKSSLCPAGLGNC